MKNLWLVARQDVADYDDYVSAVVIAEDSEQARHIHPDGWPFGTRTLFNQDKGVWQTAASDGKLSPYSLDVFSWPPPSEVNVEYLGPYEGVRESGTVLCADCLES